ncbi:MAG TPA: hypothetical protein PKE57_08000, partial [Cellvibrionaceae bacterium]|nr:hypothetical protein [Cellvibrionaceae bacterium]
LLAWLYRPEARLDLGLVFLMLDVPLFCLALPQTGGAASWFALALLLRVADQIPAGTRRVALFCHWTVLCYVGVLVLSSPLGEVLWRLGDKLVAGVRCWPHMGVALGEQPVLSGWVKCNVQVVDELDIALAAGINGAFSHVITN